MKSDQIIVQINGLGLGATGDSVLFNIRQTRAPKDFDGFGTIEVATWPSEHEGKTERLVLIRESQSNWQESRYASGLFACTTPEVHDAFSVVEELWKRIKGARE